MFVVLIDLSLLLHIHYSHTHTYTVMIKQKADNSIKEEYYERERGNVAVTVCYPLSDVNIRVLSPPP